MIYLFFNLLVSMFNWAYLCYKINSLKVYVFIWLKGSVFRIPYIWSLWIWMDGHDWFSLHYSKAQIQAVLNLWPWSFQSFVFQLLSVRPFVCRRKVIICTEILYISLYQKILLVWSHNLTTQNAENFDKEDPPYRRFALFCSLGNQIP